MEQHSLGALAEKPQRHLGRHMGRDKWSNGRHRIRTAYPGCTQKETRTAEISRTFWALTRRLECWLDEAKPLKVFNEGQGPTTPEDFALADLTITYWTTWLLLHGIVHPAMNDYPREDIQFMDASKYAYLI
jgi:hypothetical protein